jgi:hypothetical protein
MIRMSVVMNNKTCSFVYPTDVEHYLWLYRTSTFVSCNRTLAKRMQDKYRLTQNDSQWNLTVEPMRHIVQALNAMRKHSWLAGGTLLGIDRRTVLPVDRYSLLSSRSKHVSVFDQAGIVTVD